jgi:hypothetical protein
MPKLIKSIYGEIFEDVGDTINNVSINANIGNNVFQYQIIGQDYSSTVGSDSDLEFEELLINSNIGIRKPIIDINFEDILISEEEEETQISVGDYSILDYNQNDYLI